MLFLDLGDNRIGRGGAAALAGGILDNTSLEVRARLVRGFVQKE